MEFYKIVVLGSPKPVSRLVVSIVRGLNVDEYDPRVSENVVKTFEVDGEECHLEFVLFGSSGGVSWTESLTVHEPLREADGVLFVYDVCNRSSLDEVINSHAHVAKIVDPSDECPMIFVGTVSGGMGETRTVFPYDTDHGGCKYVEVSYARGEENVTEPFKALVRDVRKWYSVSKSRSKVLKQRLKRKEQEEKERKRLERRDKVLQRRGSIGNIFRKKKDVESDSPTSSATVSFSLPGTREFAEGLEVDDGVGRPPSRDSSHSSQSVQSIGSHYPALPPLAVASSQLSSDASASVEIDDRKASLSPAAGLLILPEVQSPSPSYAPSTPPLATPILLRQKKAAALAQSFSPPPSRSPDLGEMKDRDDERERRRSRGRQDQAHDIVSVAEAENVSLESILKEGPSGAPTPEPQRKRKKEKPVVAFIYSFENNQWELCGNGASAINMEYRRVHGNEKDSRRVPAMRAHPVSDAAREDGKKTTTFSTRFVKDSTRFMVLDPKCIQFSVRGSTWAFRVNSEEDTARLAAWLEDALKYQESGDVAPRADVSALSSKDSEGNLPFSRRPGSHERSSLGNTGALAPLLDLLNEDRKQQQLKESMRDREATSDSAPDDIIRRALSAGVEDVVPQEDRGHRPSVAELLQRRASPGKLLSSRSSPAIPAHIVPSRESSHSPLPHGRRLPAPHFSGTDDALLATSKLTKSVDPHPDDESTGSGSSSTHVLSSSSRRSSRPSSPPKKQLGSQSKIEVPISTGEPVVQLQARGGRKKTHKIHAALARDRSGSSAIILPFPLDEQSPESRSKQDDTRDPLALRHSRRIGRTLSRTSLEYSDRDEEEGGGLRHATSDSSLSSLSSAARQPGMFENDSIDLGLQMVSPLVRSSFSLSFGELEHPDTPEKNGRGRQESFSSLSTSDRSVSPPQREMKGRPVLRSARSVPNSLGISPRRVVSSAKGRIETEIGVVEEGEQAELEEEDAGREKQERSVPKQTEEWEAVRTAPKSADGLRRSKSSHSGDSGSKSSDRKRRHHRSRTVAQGGEVEGRADRGAEEKDELLSMMGEMRAILAQEKEHREQLLELYSRDQKGDKLPSGVSEVKDQLPLVSMTPEKAHEKSIDELLLLKESFAKKLSVLDDLISDRTKAK